MQSDPKTTLANLLVEQGQAAVEMSAEIFALGEHWVRTCVEIGGANQAWLAQINVNDELLWIASWPVNKETHHFAPQEIAKVIQSKQPSLYQDHKETTVEGIFPILRNGRVIGLLGLLSELPDFFKPPVVKWIQSLTETASFSITQLEFQTRKIQAENSISHILHSSSNPKETLPSVLEILVNLVGAEAAFILKHNPAKQQFDLLATHGFEPRTLAKVYFYIQDGLAKRVAEERKTILEENKSFSEINSNFTNPFGPEGLNVHIALPLIGHLEVIGVLEMFWREAQDTETWVSEVLQFAGESITVALERHAIFENLKRHNDELTTTYTTTIEGLSRALELRDLETEGHTRRVSVLAVYLAERMQIPVEQRAAIQQGALLHDIGKLGIPDAILLKPGSLTPREWKIMQQHPLYAYKILAPIINLQKALEIPLYHHERWDGSGYPYGLKGEQIPLSARLFAVVDVYDALTSDRPYRAAWPKSQVLEYFREQAGVQFDPGVVAKFLGLIQELK